MENGVFNPTKKDLLTIDNLILDIKVKKSQLVNRKISLQNSITELKNKRKTLPYKSKEFKRVDGVLSNITQHINGIELKIKSINEELSYKNKVRNEVEYHVKAHKTPQSEDVFAVLNKLNELKKKYTEFTQDRTRIASLRVMASEVVSELDKIIKSI